MEIDKVGSGAAGSPLVVVMGVSGSGKTTVGVALAARLGVRFVDGDDLHPPSNVAKMAAGHPLTDADRAPWLVRVAAALTAAAPTGLVVACSALKRSYRDVIVRAEPRTIFLHLTADRAVLAERLADRHGHFMPAALLDSQLATLEPLAADERGAVIDVAPSPDLVADTAFAAVRRLVERSPAEPG